MKKFPFITVGLVLTLILVLPACGSIDNYSAHHGPYDRVKLCESLNRQLMHYDDPSYYAAHPISQPKLNTIYEEYKVNGCDK